MGLSLVKIPKNQLKKQVELFKISFWKRFAYENKKAKFKQEFNLLKLHKLIKWSNNRKPYPYLMSAEHEAKRRIQDQENCFLLDLWMVQVSFKEGDSTKRRPAIRKLGVSLLIISKLPYFDFLKIPLGLSAIVYIDETT